MEFNFRGKTALITGAGKRSGIGGAIGRRFAECGANVILTDLGSSAASLEKPAHYEYGSSSSRWFRSPKTSSAASEWMRSHLKWMLPKQIPF